MGNIGNKAYNSIKIKGLECLSFLLMNCLQETMVNINPVADSINDNDQLVMQFNDLLFVYSIKPLIFFHPKVYNKPICCRWVLNFFSVYTCMRCLYVLFYILADFKQIIDNIGNKVENLPNVGTLSCCRSLLPTHPSETAGNTCN